MSAHWSPPDHTVRAQLWRGAFIEEFARAELHVSEALVRLTTFASLGKKSLLPHLNGQRIAALKAVVTGELSREGTRVAAILHEIEAFQRVRAFVCHGSGEVMQDSADLWRLELTLVNFVGTRVERSALTLDEIEAEQSLTQLRSARVRLEGQLSGLLEIFRHAGCVNPGPDA